MLAIILIVLAITTGGLVYMTPSERVFKQEITKRPVIVTIVCILGILGSLGSFIFVFSPFVRKIGEWAPAVYGLIIALKFISFIGVWHMKKWGVLLFLSTFIADVVFALLTADLSYIGIGFSVLYTVFFLIFYRKMQNEL